MARCPIHQLTETIDVINQYLWISSYRVFDHPSSSKLSLRIKSGSWQQILQYYYTTVTRKFLQPESTLRECLISDMDFSLVSNNSTQFRDPRDPRIRVQYSRHRERLSRKNIFFLGKIGAEQQQEPPHYNFRFVGRVYFIENRE